MTRAASDGRWLSLANPRRQSPLLREAKAAGHVYQAALRAELTRELGAEWQAVVNGYADLAGHRAAGDRPLLPAAGGDRRGDGRAGDQLRRRPPKSPPIGPATRRTTRVDPDTQRAEWISRAAEFDLTPESIDRMLARGRRREPRPIGAEQLDRALADLEAHHSHFDRRDLLSALANQLREGADAAALEAGGRVAARRQRLIEVHRGAGPLDSTYYTTPAPLADGAALHGDRARRARTPEPPWSTAPRSPPSSTATAT